MLAVTRLGADFRSCGVLPGLAIRNITDGSSGNISASSENYFLCTLAGGVHNSFYAGDQYEIYKTATYGAQIETHYLDRRYGHKFVNPDELVDGIKEDEVDVDEYERNVFGPGQPEKNLRGY